MDKLEKLCYRHMFYFNMSAENLVLCKEIDFDLLKEGEVLGSGASGTVTKVCLNGKDVAVKKFRVAGLVPEDCDTFRTEILIASHLDHPTIIKWFVFVIRLFFVYDRD
jgi:serine/threonine protein kinase